MTKSRPTHSTNVQTILTQTHSRMPMKFTTVSRPMKPRNSSQSGGRPTSG